MLTVAEPRRILAYREPVDMRRSFDGLLGLVRVVHIILVNCGTHKTAAIHRWLLQHPRVQLHFTPVGASWPNLGERWFARPHREADQAWEPSKRNR